MNWAEQLASLSALHDAGALSEEEFAQAKRKVLADLGPTAPPDPADVSDPTISSVNGSGGTMPTAQPAPRGVSAPVHGSRHDRVYRAIHRAGDRGITTAALSEAVSMPTSDVLDVGAVLVDDHLVQLDPAEDRWVRRPGAPWGAGTSPTAVRRTTGMRFPSGASPSPPAAEPKVGGWGWAVFFLWIIGGAIGYFALKDDDPRRANHVMKWGLIWSVIGWPFWFIVTLSFSTAL